MKKIGATYICKLFSMAERFVLLKDVMELSVLCVKVYILIEKLKRRLQKLNLIFLKSIIKILKHLHVRQ